MNREQENEFEKRIRNLTEGLSHEQLITAMAISTMRTSVALDNPEFANWAELWIQNERRDDKEAFRMISADRVSYTKEWAKRSAYKAFRYDWYENRNLNFEEIVDLVR